MPWNEKKRHNKLKRNDSFIFLCLLLIFITSTSIYVLRTYSQCAFHIYMDGACFSCFGEFIIVSGTNAEHYYWNEMLKLCMQNDVCAARWNNARVMGG